MRYSRDNESDANFTPRAQHVLALSRKEADRFNHNFVGTEHLLLGLIALGQGTAVNVLQKMGLNLETVRMEVEKQVGTGPDQKMIGNIPYTPRVRKALTLAVKEATALNHTFVGTLGLLAEGDGVAARVLRNLDVDIETTRKNILKELDPNLPGEPVLIKSESTKPQADTIDLTKRYDVYCREGDQEMVYRNVLFKSMKRLFPKRSVDMEQAMTGDFNLASVAFDKQSFIELEEADGRSVFVAAHSVTKFREHPVPDAG